MAKGRKKLSPKASNWDRIKNQRSEDSIANRDVFENQQLDRSDLGKVKTPTWRVVLALTAGLITAIAVWVVWSVGAMGIHAAGEAIGDMSGGEKAAYYDSEVRLNGEGGQAMCYFPIDAEGNEIGEGSCYEDEDDVPVPDWYAEQEAAQSEDAGAEEEEKTLSGYLFTFGLWKILMSLGLGAAVWGTLHTVLMRNLEAQNLMHDTTDINQYDNDQHIMLPEELQQKYDFFPDVGAHSAVAPSSMLSHMMFSNKGLKKVEVPVRLKEDILDDDGEVLRYAGEPKLDAEGNVVTQMVPAIDEKFGEALFDASGLPADKRLRKHYDTTAIDYNPGGGNRDRLGEKKGDGELKTVADLVNKDWVMPHYETQGPAGAYVVDTAPVNTMVLAITRGGKGQTYIEPMLDMWMREKRQHNMVINDPKGELLYKNYVRATMRGYQVVQFNLINAMKTDIYNPLAMAAESAREGDSTKTAMYVENIADVFFPTDGGEDPVWPNAANNAFKRAAYGLIDYYLEEEREMRQRAALQGRAEAELEVELDRMWGRVTLYNTYQLFVQLSSKKMKRPTTLLNERAKKGEFDTGEIDENGNKELSDQYYNLMDEAQKRDELWGSEAEVDMLSLFFTATEKLPTNTMRTLIGNAHNALKSMAGAEKMLASVYGIAITAMSFFTDPTIATLTSGTPSQNVDLGGLSFPRRMGVRFSQNYVKRESLVGMGVRWDAFSDDQFSQPLGKDFEHSDTVSREGWARYYFDGKFPEDVSYLRLRLFNPKTEMLTKTFYFKFRKGMQTSLNGDYFVTDPITKKKIVKNGTLSEILREGEKYVKGDALFTQERLTDISSNEPRKVEARSKVFMQTQVRYSEQPKAVFLVTPPHLMKYAKLILILVKQLVDLNFDQSYMTKSNQKPLYKTRFMIDELGNLQSEGKGISGFETMLSIGLGQEQQFTLILQTLQQLRDVYGESVDKIVQGNVSNIIFLKSTDDTMIETLSKMSGTRHRVYKDSKTVTKDVEKLAMRTEGKASYTMSAKEEPVISMNDMMYITERNSIVFRAGDSPIWNRNETILPMSWRLFKDTITVPGKEFTLQTVPTLSTAMEFDVRQNQPDFGKMLEKRIIQALNAEDAKKAYAKAYGYSDFQISTLDPDVYAADVMDLVDIMTYEQMDQSIEEVEHNFDPEELEGQYEMQYEENTEQLEATAAAADQRKGWDDLVYAGKTLSKGMFMDTSGSVVVGKLQDPIVESYLASMSFFEADGQFRVDDDGSLFSSSGTPYILHKDESAAMKAAREAAQEEGTRTYSEDDESVDSLTAYEVTREFYEFLVSGSSWSFADGKFDYEMSLRME